MKTVALVVCLGSLSALADPDPFGVASRVDAEQSVGAYLGFRALGVSATRAAGDAAQWRVSGHWFFLDRYASVHGTRTGTWLQRGSFGLSHRVGASLHVVPAGPFAVGVGVNGALFAGWTFNRFAFAFGPELGADAFVRPLGVRAPARLTLSASVRLGTLKLGVTGSAGADFERDRFPTGRFSAGVFLEPSGLSL